MEGGLTEEVSALRSGRAWVDLRAWCAVEVTGADAARWLHDLLTADIAGLVPGRARRSLLLTPTGRIRADVHVARRPEALLLLQRRDQPQRIDDLLAPYRLSSDVRLAPVDVAVLAIPGGQPPARLVHEASMPSALGPGVDVIVEARRRAAVVEALTAVGLREVSDEAAEVVRIARGDPRMGADFGPDALPSEVGLDATIDTTKGCFLGQESVAKVRNLGHPPRTLALVRSDGPVRPGQPVLAGDDRVGEVTSATADEDAWFALIRVGWDAREAPWTTEDGRPLRAVPRST